MAEPPDPAPDPPARAVARPSRRRSRPRCPAGSARVIAPLIAIAPVAGPLDLDGAQGLLFTSANGVEQFAARSAERGLPAFCVGAMTAEAARRGGLLGALGRRRRGGAGRARRSRRTGPGAGRVRARARPPRGGRPDRRGSRRRGCRRGRPRSTTRSPRPLAAGGGGAAGRAARVRAVALFSPRSARLLRHGGRAPADGTSAPLAAVSLSAAVDAALDRPDVGAPVVAEAPTREGMIAALARI